MMKKHEERSNYEVKELALEAVKAEIEWAQNEFNIFQKVNGHERALAVLLVRLGYSPHNAFAHSKLVPLADDPREYSESHFPHQTPALDK